MDDVVELAPMFAAGEALVQRIVDQLARFATTPTLSKTQTISPVDVSRALDVAFWASVTSNEGRATRARILVAPPEMLPSPLRFDAAHLHGRSRRGSRRSRWPCPGRRAAPGVSAERDGDLGDDRCGSIRASS